MVAFRTDNKIKISRTHRCAGGRTLGRSRGSLCEAGVSAARSEARERDLGCVLCFVGRSSTAVVAFRTDNKIKISRTHRCAGGRTLGTVSGLSLRSGGLCR